MPAASSTALALSSISEDSDLVPWAAPAVPSDPTRGLVAAQQEAWHRRLSEDRKLIYYDKQERFSELLKSALKPAEKSLQPAPLPELLPEVVQEIMDSVVADPAQELAERRDARVGESLALHLERLLSCSPPAALREVLGRDCGSIRLTEALPPPAPGLPHLVLFVAPRGAAPAAWQLRRRLNASAPTLGAALAQRLLLAAPPLMRFDVKSSRGGAADGSSRGETSGLRSRRSVLWRVAKRERKLVVHRAAGSFTKNMAW